ncbi:MAG: hypothetical protein LUG51_00660 [Tannerellaceae bacterium]|nr:hypothetical protein [Tannerellaceae bacterium]
MKLKKVKNSLTEYEKLLAEKCRVKASYKELEYKMDEDLKYLQHHGGSMILSSITSTIFPKSKDHHQEGPDETEKSSGLLGSLNFSDYLSIGKSLLPVAFSIAQPFLISWGLGKVQSGLTHSLLKWWKHRKKK